MASASYKVVSPVSDIPSIYFQSISSSVSIVPNADNILWDNVTLILLFCATTYYQKCVMHYLCFFSCSQYFKEYKKRKLNFSVEYSDFLTSHIKYNKACNKLCTTLGYNHRVIFVCGSLLHRYTMTVISAFSYQHGLDSIPSSGKIGFTIHFKL